MAGEITRSAAEDFALLIIYTSSGRYAADLLSAVAGENVSFSDMDQKISIHIYNYKNLSDIICKALYSIYRSKILHL